MPTYLPTIYESTNLTDQKKLNSYKARTGDMPSVDITLRFLDYNLPASHSS